MPPPLLIVLTGTSYLASLRGTWWTTRSMVRRSTWRIPWAEPAASLEPDEAAHAISMVYTTMLPDELRSRYGIYYTPPALTERLITLATEAGIDWSRCRVLDPACGGGAFMAPAAMRIAAELAGCKPALILQRSAPACAASRSIPSPPGCHKPFFRSLWPTFAAPLTDRCLPW